MPPTLLQGLLKSSIVRPTLSVLTAWRAAGESLTGLRLPLGSLLNSAPHSGQRDPFDLRSRGFPFPGLSTAPLNKTVLGRQRQGQQTSLLSWSRSRAGVRPRTKTWCWEEESKEAGERCCGEGAGRAAGAFLAKVVGAASQRKGSLSWCAGGKGRSDSDTQGRVVQEEGTADAKVLWQKHAGDAWAPARRWSGVEETMRVSHRGPGGPWWGLGLLFWVSPGTWPDLGFHRTPPAAEWRTNCRRQGWEQGAQRGGNGGRGRGEKWLESGFDGKATGSADGLTRRCRGKSRVKGPLEFETDSRAEQLKVGSQAGCEVHTHPYTSSLGWSSTCSS